MGRKNNWDLKIGNKKNDAWNGDKVFILYFYMNFPPDVDSKKLWLICESYGHVSNVYIARKLSKLGKHFAFVRFIKVKDQKQLEVQYITFGFVVTMYSFLWLNLVEIYLVIIGLMLRRISVLVWVELIGLKMDILLMVLYANVVKGGVITNQTNQKSFASLVMEGKTSLMILL